MNLILQMQCPSRPQNKYRKRSAPQGHSEVRLPVWFDGWRRPWGLGRFLSPNAYSVVAIRTGALRVCCCYFVIVVFTTKEQSLLGTVAVFLAADETWVRMGFEELLGR